MSAWVDRIREALDARDEPVTFFFRYDDAGWDDDALVALVGTCAEHGAPLDLAVIPGALTPPLARRLAEWHDGGLVGLHQHGRDHVNHEPTGRSCEFGASRDVEAQRVDLTSGRARLLQLVGRHRVDPIFTPPWNRCTADTGAVLGELGITALSREGGAAPLDVPGLCEIPIHIDWLKRRRGERLTREDVGALIGDAVRDRDRVGVMFHHAAMDGVERRAVGELLSVIGAHRNARWSLMRDLLAGDGSVILARHGHTAWNGLRYIGWADPPLDARGRAEAEALRRALGDHRFDAVHASPLRRAWETAAAVAAGRDVPVTCDPDLRERGLGDLEGMPKTGASRPARDADSAPPGGESLAQAFARARHVADRLLGEARQGRRVVAVGHRRINALLHAALIGAETVDQALAQPAVPVATGTAIEVRFTFTPDGKASTWTCPLATTSTSTADTALAR